MNELERGLAEWKKSGGILVDLRDAEDFAYGHIPGAVNISPETVREDVAAAAETDTPIFLYCYAGMRSWQAEALLQAMGYEKARSIGGVEGYRGELTEPD